MTDLRAAAQQALEALELVTDLTNHDDEIYDAIDALRAALAEPVTALAAERDAVLRQLDDDTNQTLRVKRKRWAALVRLMDAQLQRKPLSGVAIYGLFVRSGLGAYHQKDFVVQTEYDRCIERFARAVERAHGIGGEG